MNPMPTPRLLSTLRPALLGTALTTALAMTSGWAQTAKPAVRPGEPVMLNFVNADIDAVARTVATLSGANVVVDPRVKGTMNLTSTVAVPPAQALRLFVHNCARRALRWWKTTASTPWCPRPMPSCKAVRSMRAMPRVQADRS